MRVFTLVFLMLSCSFAAQSLNREYIKGISFNTSKEQAIEVALDLAEYYYRNDLQEIHKRLRKHMGIKLSKRTMEPFIDEMRGDLRTMLEQNSTWGQQLGFQDKYAVEFPYVIGQWVEIPGTGSNTQLRYAYYTFENNQLKSISASVHLVEYSTSALPYTRESLAQIRQATETNFGPVRVENSEYSLRNWCNRTETHPSVDYHFVNRDYSGKLTTKYIPWYRNSDDCNPNGAKMISVSLEIKRL